MSYLLANLNIWTVLVAVASTFVLGAIWYSPLMFGNIWMTAENSSTKKVQKHHNIVVYGISFLFAFIAVIGFALVVGLKPTIATSLKAAFLIGICWVATSFGINYLFAGRKVKLLLIDAGYHLMQFILYGFIFGFWH